MIFRRFNHPADIAAASIFAIIFLSACSGDTKPLPYPMTLKEEGLGKIGKETPFDAPKVGALLPGFEVTPYTSFREGTPYPILRITRHGHEIMIISPSDDKQRLGTLSILTPAIPSAEGHRLGDSFASIFSMAAPSCRSGADELANKTLCRAAGSEHIFYLFPSSGPASDVHQPLPQSTVEEILWMP